MSETVDHRIGRIAAKQQNIITRVQLLELYLSGSAIDNRIRRGRLHREFPGVYSVGRPAVTPYEHSSAAVLACGPGAKLAGESAMCIWGFWGRWPKQPEVVVPGDRRPKGITVHRCTTLTRGDVARHHGIPVTNPAHTILVVAPRLTEDQLWRTIDDALHTPYLHRASLIDQIIRHHLYPGARLLREYLLTGDGPTRSDKERAIKTFCLLWGLPIPLLSVMVAGREADAYWANEGVILEFDSWEFHSSRRAFERDRDRDVDMLVAEKITVRLTWRRLFMQPAREAARLQALLELRRRRAA
jgi:hypothetical protein